MNENDDLSLIEAESGGGGCGCGCGGAKSAAATRQPPASIDPAALLRELDAIEMSSGDTLNELTMALGEETLSLEEELEFAAAADQGSFGQVEMSGIMELIQARPGLKVTLSY